MNDDLLQQIMRRLGAAGGAAKDAFLDAGRRQREAIGRMTSGNASPDDYVDMAADFAMPFSGATRKAALSPAELSIRGILDMADDRLAGLGKSQFAKLRNAAPMFLDDIAEAVEPGMLSKARNRLFEEAKRRAARDAELRMADQLAPNQFFESPASAADMARSNGPRSGAWARKYR